MTFVAHFKQMDSIDQLRHYAEEKSRKLEKLFDGQIRVHWEFFNDREGRVARCRVLGVNPGFSGVPAADFTGCAAAPDFLQSVDLAVARLQRQIHRRKEILTERLHRRPLRDA